MKPSRFTKEQIVGILRQAKEGVRVVDLCYRHGISDVTFTSGDKFGDMKVSNAKRLWHIVQFVESQPRTRMPIFGNVCEKLA